jgi:hypothetical protein
MGAPADGGQDGVLATWSTDGTPYDLRAAWCDSWHQQPAVMEMTGRAADDRVTLEGTYGETWGWQIVIEHAASDALRVVMLNVIPSEVATDEIGRGPYETWITELAPASPAGR